MKCDAQNVNQDITSPNVTSSDMGGINASLIENDASTTHYKINIDNQKKKGIGNNTIASYSIDNWLNYTQESRKMLKHAVSNDIDNVVNYIVYGLSSVFPLRWYYPTWLAKLIVLGNHYMWPMFIQDLILNKMYFAKPIVQYN